MPAYDAATKNGDLLDSLTTGPNLTIQGIRRALGLWAGELPGKRRAGRPFLSWLARRPFPVAEAAANIQAAILAVDGVKSALVTGDQTGANVVFTAQVALTGGGRLVVTLSPPANRPGQNSAAAASIFIQSVGAIL